MSISSQTPDTSARAKADVTVIEPPGAGPNLRASELWAFRSLFWALVTRDIKVRYKQTALGFAWAILQPFMLMLVFSVFFGALAKVPSDGYPYPLFVFAGLLPWMFFANAISTSARSVVGAQHLVNKVYFPRLLIPLSSIGASLLDFFVAGIVLVLMLLAYDVSLSLQLLWVPLLTLAIIFTALGVGTLLAALAVRYRDFGHVVPFMVQLWLFATPVVYPASLVPAQWQWVLNLNPIAGLITAFRAACLGQTVDWQAAALSLAVGVGIFVLAIIYFDRTERSFADVI